MPRRPAIVIRPSPSRGLAACSSALAVLLVFSLGTSRASETIDSHAALQPQCQSSPPQKETRRKAQAWLWSKQGQDGGWRSETYGLLRSGQALTPFILHTLMESSAEAQAPQGAVQRAREFIRARVNKDGLLGLHEDGIVEYPVYASAYALRCLVRAREPSDAPLIARMTARLAALQFQPQNGYERDAPAHGGWGFGPHPRGSPGHMDLAHTHRVLEALRDAGGLDGAARERACWFLALLQRLPDHPRRQPASDPLPGAARYKQAYDGGFYFSPVVFPANKGGTATLDDGRTAFFRSYATATSDGALALLAAGVKRDDARVAAAKSWLERNASLDLPDGVPAGAPDSYASSIRYYHLAVRAEAHAALEIPGPWRETIAQTLAARQRADGSFINTESHLMKEDDPLICTALALIALHNTE